MRYYKTLFYAFLIVAVSFFGVPVPDVHAVGTGRVLVVGGGGGADGSGGGGGAGGVVYNATYALSAQAYTVTVGAGGSSSVTPSAGGGTRGSDSVFGSITAGGGGLGAHTQISPACTGKATNGSGGGQDYNNVCTSAKDGAGTVGGSGNNDGGSGDSYPGGGGGGAGGGGGNASGSNGGNGGTGIADASIGDLLAMTSSGAGGRIAAGGGAGVRNAGTAGNGGTGGGGAGGRFANGTDATANTGSGGGSGGLFVTYVSGQGASGLVLVVYPTAEFTHTGGNATGTSGSETWVKFTSSGTLTLAANSSGGSSGQLIED